MNFKKIIKIQKIENLYEKAFSRIGMGSFMKLAWNNIKVDFNSEPNMLEVSARLMIEEILVYEIAVDGEEGYKKIKKMVSIELKTFEKISAYYKNYIDMLINYLKKHPEMKIEFFKRYLTLNYSIYKSIE